MDSQKTQDSQNNPKQNKKCMTGYCIGFQAILQNSLVVPENKQTTIQK